ncbi:MAG TPA: tetratricopeptide repeat protein, partial [Candidatus Limnocylindria bacterium]|nr:tetratricopeptide repeat protein [Candidatus Limnocylindria bacterium]
MGLLDIFKKKQPPAKLGATEGNRVDELFNRLSREGQAHTIEAALADLERETLNRAEQESWHRLWGVVAFRRNDHQEAFERFKRAADLFPDSARISFLLGQEHEFRGDTEAAFGQFDRAVFPAIPAAYSLMAARYAYLWDELDRGIEYLRPIFDAYVKLGIGDDHFVFTRGLPFFSQTWGYLACFRYLKSDPGSLLQETESMATR